MFFGCTKIQNFSQINKYLAHRNHGNHRNLLGIQITQIAQILGPAEITEILLIDHKSS